VLVCVECVLIVDFGCVVIIIYNLLNFVHLNILLAQFFSTTVAKLPFPRMFMGKYISSKLFITQYEESVSHRRKIN
jgi:hypothetical protein